MQLTVIQVEREEFLHSRILERSDRIKSDWLQISNDLKEIKKDKLYLRKAKTFEEYCEVFLDIARSTVNRLIAGSDVIENLNRAHGRGLPTSERQARPLTKLEPELQREAWAEVIEENEPEAITAKIITAKVETKKDLNEAVREVKRDNMPNTIFVQTPLTEKEILKKAKEIMSKEKTIKIEARKIYIEQQKQDIINEDLPTINSTFDVLAFDPPWPYGREYDPSSSRVANPYPEMTIKEITELRVPSKSDSIMFLWTTHRFLPDAFDILKAWGFEYKATMVWNKEKMGMGHWLRMQCEFCLLGIKGKPIWDIKNWRDIITEPRRQHSRKPDAFYKDIDERFNYASKIEYFSREERDGWFVYGNDTKKF